MPNTHYQRVLEQDRQLPWPMRWLTRAMSSWWLIGILGVFVVGYVAMAHVPIGGRYLWQHRLIDTTQQRVLTWSPLMTAAWLLAAAVVWSATRRLAWRWDNLGRFVAVIGLATILVSQSWAFRGQTTGVAAVPVTTTKGDNPADPLSLTYTTRYGDTAARDLVIMLGPDAPINVPLDDLPRWNDAAGDHMPTIRLHDDPKLASILGYRVRITPVAYLADGKLTDHPDGTQTVKPTPAQNRNTTALPYPADALVAIKFEVEHDDGETDTTTVWLPFEPAGTESLAPKRFYQVQGMGTVGLAFRPVSKKLAFAVAASADESNHLEQLYTADTDTSGKLLQPTTFDLYSTLKNPAEFQAENEYGRLDTYKFAWIGAPNANPASHIYISVATSSLEIFITAGLITFLAGVALDLLLGFVGPKAKRNATTMPAKSV